MKAVTEQEFEEWLQNPVTEKLRKRLFAEVEMLKELLVAANDIEGVKELQGRVKATMALYEVKYQDLFEEKEKGRTYE